MTSMQRANGVGSTYSYDADGWLIGSTTGNLASISLTRDAAGRIISADRNLPLATALPDSSDSFNYDAASQLSTATYDGSGRVTSQGTRTYAWDGASRLTSFTDTSGNSASLTYDSLGEIASIANGSTTNSFKFNYALRLPAVSVVQQNGADLRYYVYLPNGKLLYSIEAADNSRHFYHFDEQGNTAFLTDDAGNITDSYSISPYGEVLNPAARQTIRLRSRANTASSRRLRDCIICAAATMMARPHASCPGIR
jgi:YD repeat-containing protein